MLAAEKGKGGAEVASITPPPGTCQAHIGEGTSYQGYESQSICRSVTISPHPRTFPLGPCIPFPMPPVQSFPRKLPRAGGEEHLPSTGPPDHIWRREEARQALLRIDPPLTFKICMHFYNACHLCKQRMGVDELHLLIFSARLIFLVVYKAAGSEKQEYVNIFFLITSSYTEGVVGSGRSSFQTFLGEVGSFRSSWVSLSQSFSVSSTS